MFRFTIRDVLWLTVVVALGVGWLVDHLGARSSLVAAKHEIIATQVFLRESGGLAEYRNGQWVVGDSKGNFIELSRAFPTSPDENRSVVPERKAGPHSRLCPLDALLNRLY